MKRVSLHIFLSILLLVLVAKQGFCQVSLTAANLIYLQNFDTYSGNNINTVPQWTIGGTFAYRGLGNGSSNSGGSWAYGIGSERALGYLGSGTSSSINYGISFVNNTAGPITQLEISYDFEQWRFVSGNTLGWSVAGTGVLASVSMIGLNTNSVNVGVTGTVQVTPKSILLTGLNLLPNATFGIKWSCSDGAGNDNGIAIDNFRLAVVCSPSIVSIDTTLCAGASFVLNGNTYTTPQIVSDTLLAANGCDSIVNYELNFLPAITHSFADTICAGVTYNWGSQNLTASGNYNQTFPSFTNCDSTVTLNLFVRPAITYSFADTICAGATYNWGSQSLTASGNYNQTFPSFTNCDSIVTLNLFVRPAITYSFADTICAATTYNWSSQSLTASGNYNQTFPSFTNCDSIVTLNLFVRPAITYSFADTICVATTYNWGSQSLTTNGSYNQTFPSFTNCDSIVTLNLFVRSAITHSFADTICGTATYNWGSQSLTASGSYNQIFTSATSCDSVVTLNLFVRSAITHSFTDTICGTATYNWGSQSLTASGSYNQIFTSATSCDSVVTLNLFVRPAINTSDSQSICSGMSYSFGSQLLTASGIYAEVFQDINSCDSNVTLTLNVSSVITNNIAATICYGATYNWGIQTLNTTGVYNQSFTSSSSCDSVVTLNLIVNPLMTDTLNETLCFGQTFTLGNQVLNTSGTYNQTFPATNGCDSLVILHLVVQPLVSDTMQASICYGGTYTLGSQALSASGYYLETFTSITGCDSIVTLNLQVNPQPAIVTIDTAACGTVWFEGIAYTSSITLTDTFFTTLGCDSLYRIVNINPHTNNPTVQTIDTANCGPLVFEGNLFTESTTLSDTIFNILGCDSIVRAINIKINNVETQTIVHEMCAGNIFTFNGQQYATAGSYPFSFKNQAGCDSLITLKIKINPLPGIEIIKDNQNNYCVGDSIILQASGAQFYSWIYEDVDTLEGDYFRTILFRYKNAFSITGIDINGCRDTASIHIDAQACCNIWMPNAFSPNADGINDIFKPEAGGHPKEYVMHIYNRWGQTVFSSFNIAQGWDGNINGKPADIADYYYRISGKCVNGETINLKGVCTLIR
jgi:gliding motility-associated-like protein